MGLGIGKRTLKRRAMNARLKRMFVENGYPQECELKLGKCQKTWALSWAHSKKSRFLITDEDWLEAALACQNCHNEIECLPHDQMKTIVIRAISSRKPETATPSFDAEEE